MSGLNAHQQRHVSTVFARIDALLRDVERLARGDPSPFAAERADVNPEQTRLLGALAASLRRRMLFVLDELGIERPRQTHSARWTIQTAFRFADIGLTDVDAAHLRGYGAVDPVAGRLLETLVADLRALVAQGVVLVRDDRDANLEQRVAQLPGPIGEALRALEHFIVGHDLVELRWVLADAADRALDDVLVVGIFGRVSAGKSSFINALLGTTALPIGTTPVTSVSLRVCHGEPAALVQLITGDAHLVSIAELSMYATEDQNPDNRFGVRTIRVTVPNVPEGLCLLDTPGVGSLAASGPAQAYASLPRCDIGLVMVAAGSPVGQEEQTLVSSLVNAGVACKVLLSKADLLGETELLRSLTYVRREIDSILGRSNEVGVVPVSVVENQPTGIDAIRRDLFATTVEARRQTLNDLLRRRILAVVALAADTLARPQLARSAEQAPAPLSSSYHEEAPLVTAQRQLPAELTRIVALLAPDGRVPTADEASEGAASG